MSSAHRKRSGSWKLNVSRQWSPWIPMAAPCTRKCSNTARQNSRNGSDLLRLCVHWPIRRHQSLIPADERRDVSVAHLLRCVRGQDRPVSTATIHDDFRGDVRHSFFEVALQYPFSEVKRSTCMILLPLGILPHIH